MWECLRQTLKNVTSSFKDTQVVYIKSICVVSTANTLSGSFYFLNLSRQEVTLTVHGGVSLGGVRVRRVGG